jgi:DUF218 domain
MTLTLLVLLLVIATCCAMSRRRRSGIMFFVISLGMVVAGRFRSGCWIVFNPPTRRSPQLNGVNVMPLFCWARERKKYQAPTPLNPVFCLWRNPCGVPTSIARCCERCGDPRRHGVSEAKAYQATLLSLKVSPDDVLTESESMNTWQNAQFSLGL